MLVRKFMDLSMWWRHLANTLGMRLVEVLKEHIPDIDYYVDDGKINLCSNSFANPYRKEVLTNSLLDVLDDCYPNIVEFVDTPEGIWIDEDEYDAIKAKLVRFDDEGEEF